MSGSRRFAEDCLYYDTFCVLGKYMQNVRFKNGSQECIPRVVVHLYSKDTFFMFGVGLASIPVINHITGKGGFSFRACRDNRRHVFVAKTAMIRYTERIKINFNNAPYKYRQ